MLAAAVAAGPARSAEPSAPLHVELNKLEPAGSACRVYMVFDNRGDAAFDAFKLDLVLFGRDGVIVRRLAVEAGPLRAAKKTVKLFDAPDLSCDAIGSVLLNGVIECRADHVERPDCLDHVAVSSRAAAALSK